VAFLGRNNQEGHRAGSSMGFWAFLNRGGPVIWPRRGGDEDLPEIAVTAMKHDWDRRHMPNQDFTSMLSDVASCNHIW
jgi:hypothetical protein